MFTNKHVIIALLVAPILSVIAWFMVGSLVGEKPHQAKPGQTYPLVERSNCRYDSGVCDLDNQDFELQLSLQNESERPKLLIQTSHALDSLMLAITDESFNSAPAPLTPTDEQRLQWALELPSLPANEQRIRLVATTAGVTWYAEASTNFLDPYR